MMAARAGRWLVDQATEADLDPLAELLAASPLQQRYGVTRAGAAASMEVAFREGDLILVCRPALAAPPVGLAWLIQTRILDQGAYLRLLLVDEQHQGRGLGERLLHAGEAAIHATSNHLYLLVTRDNLRARRFYERHGYRHVGDLPELVRPGLDEALYHKTLRHHDPASR